MSVCSLMVLRCSPLLTSHTLRVPTYPALTSSSPYGLKARERTGGQGCATLLHRHCSLARSHSLTTPSASLLASSRPSGLKATDQISWCSCQTLRQLPVS